MSVHVIKLCCSIKIKHSTRYAFIGYALGRDDRSLFIRLFVYSRVKGRLNRSVRATRERLHFGHCFRAAGEFGGQMVTRFTACGYPQLELLRESRGFIWNFSKLRLAPSSQSLTTDAKSVLLRISKLDLTCSPYLAFSETKSLHKRRRETKAFERKLWFARNLRKILCNMFFSSVTWIESYHCSRNKPEMFKTTYLGSFNGQKIWTNRNYRMKL